MKVKSNPEVDQETIQLLQHALAGTNAKILAGSLTASEVFPASAAALSTRPLYSIAAQAGCKGWTGYEDNAWYGFILWLDSCDTEEVVAQLQIGGGVTGIAGILANAIPQLGATLQVGGAILGLGGTYLSEVNRRGGDNGIKIFMLGVDPTAPIGGVVPYYVQPQDPQ